MVATAAEAEKLRWRRFNAHRGQCHDAIETDCTREAACSHVCGSEHDAYL